jgi:hypothetical protein
MLLVVRAMRTTPVPRTGDREGLIQVNTCAAMTMAPAARHYIDLYIAHHLEPAANRIYLFFDDPELARYRCCRDRALLRNAVMARLRWRYVAPTCRRYCASVKPELGHGAQLVPAA